MAATYPLEVVQATRWLQDPNHAALTGSALAAALDLRPWDPSVKALVSFPEILRMMDGALEWTEAVGDAFLSDEVAVMDAIQRLRQRAQSAGTLVTTPQQMVLTQDQAIGILPADPQVVYVPMYDPAAVYGPWVYAPSPFFGYPVVAPIGVVGGLRFGVGIVVVPSLWGWHHWDWPHHRLHVDGDRFRHITGHRPPPVASGNTTRSIVTGSLTGIRELAPASWALPTATCVATGRAPRRGQALAPGAVPRRRAPRLREALPRPA